MPQIPKIQKEPLLLDVLTQVHQLRADVMGWREEVRLKLDCLSVLVKDLAGAKFQPLPSGPYDSEIPF